MTDTFRIALAQLNLVVGDIAGNCERIRKTIETARDEHHADLVVFPELAICGYPPEDLLFHAAFRTQVESALKSLRASASGIAVLLGYPEFAGAKIFNSAALFVDGNCAINYRKNCLPNYSVFDEERYFTPGEDAGVVALNNVQVGLMVCEDIWESEPSAASAAAGAGILIVINGSPFQSGMQARRESVIADRCRENSLPMIYVNTVGGQDELVFDGGSCVIGADGEVVMRAPAFVEGIFCIDCECEQDRVIPQAGPVADVQGDDESIYAALVTGVRDYVLKNGFPGIVLGLSGGIDSALTLAIAVDALGSDAVQAVMMPYRYTADISLEDAQAQAQTLGVDYRVLPIESMVDETGAVLRDLFAGRAADTTEENIQSRCRGLLLMAISNKTGRMVLATGNKSEMAVGYATLYGDMNGGFAPIKDCNKTLVYQLARYRNSVSAVIPERVLERPPSAELAPGQVDSDSLPPYAILDAILDAFMTEDCSLEEIVARGFDRDVTTRILNLVRRNEYKRRQAAPGVRVSGRAFGRDWRYPITSGYRHGD